MLLEEKLRDDEDIDEKDFKRLYIGQFYDGKPQGEGVMYHPGGTKVKYQGYLFNGLYSDIGELRNLRDEAEFRGSFLLGKKHGFGVEYWQNGFIKFAGDFKDDKRSGTGSEFDKFGFKIRNGIWEAGEFIG